MRITVLGCNASITGELRTTCYRVDDDILIDAGSGAGDLTLAQAVKIDVVFLTHAHLDHCCMLPMLADAGTHLRTSPLIVYALPETASVIKRNIFNGDIYPDYTALPSPERPYVRFVPIREGDSVELSGRRFTALPTRHSVPAIGYQVDSGKASWVYSADTTLCDEFWQALNRIENLRHLLIETTLRDAATPRAAQSGHMSASLLAEGLGRLARPVDVNIVHMEAGEEEATYSEILKAAGRFQPHVLKRGTVFEF